MLNIQCLTYILRFPILVLVVNIVLEAGGIYYALPWVDMPMHFLGGASIAIAGIGFLAFLSPYGGSPAGRKTQGFVNELPFLLCTFLVMSFVGLAAVSWELWEFSMDAVFSKHVQTDLFDTVGDMFFGLLGGFATSVAWLYFRKRKQ